MDFHGLKRKNLQQLCKQHGIPANLKNVEMADRLSSLFKQKKSMKRGRSCLKDSSVINDEEVTDGKDAKRVKFSPQNETFVFEKTDPREMRLLARKRRGFRESKDEDNSDLINGDTVKNVDIAEKEKPIVKNLRRRSIVVKSDQISDSRIGDNAEKEKETPVARSLRRKSAVVKPDQMPEKKQMMLTTSKMQDVKGEVTDGDNNISEIEGLKRRSSRKTMINAGKEKPIVKKLRRRSIAVKSDQISDSRIGDNAEKEKENPVARNLRRKSSVVKPDQMPKKQQMMPTTSKMQDVKGEVTDGDNNISEIEGLKKTMINVGFKAKEVVRRSSRIEKMSKVEQQVVDDDEQCHGFEYSISAEKRVDNSEEATEVSPYNSEKMKVLNNTMPLEGCKEETEIIDKVREDVAAPIQTPISENSMFQNNGDVGAKSTMVADKIEECSSSLNIVANGNLYEETATTPPSIVTRQLCDTALGSIADQTCVGESLSHSTMKPSLPGSNAATDQVSDSRIGDNGAKPIGRKLRRKSAVVKLDQMPKGKRMMPTASKTQEVKGEANDGNNKISESEGLKRRSSRKRIINGSPKAMEVERSSRVEKRMSKVEQQVLDGDDDHPSMNHLEMAADCVNEQEAIDCSIETPATVGGGKEPVTTDSAPPQSPSDGKGYIVDEQCHGFAYSNSAEKMVDNNEEATKVSLNSAKKMNVMNNTMPLEDCKDETEIIDKTHENVPAAVQTPINDNSMFHNSGDGEAGNTMVVDRIEESSPSLNIVAAGNLFEGTATTPPSIVQRQLCDTVLGSIADQTCVGGESLGHSTMEPSLQGSNTATDVRGQQTSNCLDEFKGETLESSEGIECYDQIRNEQSIQQEGWCEGSPCLNSSPQMDVRVKYKLSNCDALIVEESDVQSAVEGEATGLWISCDSIFRDVEQTTHTFSADQQSVFFISQENVVLGPDTSLEDNVQSPIDTEGLTPSSNTSAATINKLNEEGKDINKVTSLPNQGIDLSGNNAEDIHLVQSLNKDDSEDRIEPSSTINPFSLYLQSKVDGSIEKGVESCKETSDIAYVKSSNHVNSSAEEGKHKIVEQLDEVNFKLEFAKDDMNNFNEREELQSENADSVAKEDAFGSSIEGETLVLSKERKWSQVNICPGIFGSTDNQTFECVLGSNRAKYLEQCSVVASEALKGNVSSSKNNSAKFEDRELPGASHSADALSCLDVGSKCIQFSEHNLEVDTDTDADKLESRLNDDNESADWKSIPEKDDNPQLDNLSDDYAAQTCSITEEGHKEHNLAVDTDTDADKLESRLNVDNRSADRKSIPEKDDNPQLENLSDDYAALTCELIALSGSITEEGHKEHNLAVDTVTDADKLESRLNDDNESADWKSIPEKDDNPQLENLSDDYAAQTCELIALSGSFAEEGHKETSKDDLTCFVNENVDENDKYITAIEQETVICFDEPEFQNLVFGNDKDDSTHSKDLESKSVAWTTEDLLALGEVEESYLFQERNPADLAYEGSTLQYDVHYNKTVSDPIKELVCVAVNDDFDNASINGDSNVINLQVHNDSFEKEVDTTAQETAYAQEEGVGILGNESPESTIRIDLDPAAGQVYTQQKAGSVERATGEGGENADKDNSKINREREFGEVVESKLAMQSSFFMAVSEKGENDGENDIVELCSTLANDPGHSVKQGKDSESYEMTTICGSPRRKSGKFSLTYGVSVLNTDAENLVVFCPSSINQESTCYSATLEIASDYLRTSQDNKSNDTLQNACIGYVEGVHPGKAILFKDNQDNEVKSGDMVEPDAEKSVVLPSESAMPDNIKSQVLVHEMDNEPESIAGTNLVESAGTKEMELQDLQRLTSSPFSVVNWKLDCARGNYEVDTNTVEARSNMDSTVMESPFFVQYEKGFCDIEKASESVPEVQTDNHLNGANWTIQENVNERQGEDAGTNGNDDSESSRSEDLLPFIFDEVSDVNTIMANKKSINTEAEVEFNIDEGNCFFGEPIIHQDHMDVNIDSIDKDACMAKEDHLALERSEHLESSPCADHFMDSAPEHSVHSESRCPDDKDNVTHVGRASNSPICENNGMIFDPSEEKVRDGAVGDIVALSKTTEELDEVAAEDFFKPYATIDRERNHSDSVDNKADVDSLSPYVSENVTDQLQEQDHIPLMPSYLQIDPIESTDDGEHEDVKSEFVFTDSEIELFWGEATKNELQTAAAEVTGHVKVDEIANVASTVSTHKAAVEKILDPEDSASGEQEQLGHNEKQELGVSEVQDCIDNKGTENYSGYFYANNSGKVAEITEDDDKVLISSVIQRKTARSVLIHGTPKRQPVLMHDMKENATARKRLQTVDATALKPSLKRRKVLEDISK